MKRNILLVACAVIAVAIIGYGNHYWNDRMQANAQALNKAMDEQDKARQQEIDKWKPNGTPRSVIDDLRYAVAKDGNADIAAIGSSVTFGAGASSEDKSWIGKLTQYIREQKLKTIKIENVGKPGFTTTQLLKEGVIDSVVKRRPDVILFETCLLNNAGKDVPLDQTIKDIDEIMAKLKQGVPDARIIVQSPNPKPSNGKNSFGLTYKDYIGKTKTHIQANGWEYIDVYADFERQRQADGKTLEQLIPDGNHPNDTGYDYWFKTIQTYFTQRMG